MKQQLLKNTLIIGVGRIFAQFMALFLIPLYTVYLSPGEYGAADLVITYTALALPFVSLSLEQGAFRLLIENASDKAKKSLIITYALKAVAGIGVPLALIILAVGFYLDLPLLYVATLYGLSSILLNVHLWLARGLSATVPYSIASIAVGLTQLLLSLLFIIGFSMGLTGMLLALSAGFIIGVIFLQVRLGLYKYINLRLKDNSIRNELLKYSTPLIPNSLSWWLVNALDRTIIAVFLGVAATGIFAVSIKFPAILIGLFSIFWISWHESASLNIDKKGSGPFFSKVTNTVISLFGSLALLIISAVALLFNYIVGPEFSDAYLYIPILMVGAFFSSLITFYGSIYAAKKETRKILNTTLAAAAINIVVILALIHFIGLYAAAIGSTAAYLGMFLYRHRDVKSFVSVRLDVKKIVILGMAAAVIVTLYYVNVPALNAVNFAIALLLTLLMNKNILQSLKELLWKKRQKS